MLQPLANALADSAINQWVAINYWLWPILEILHFIGLSLLLGGLIVVDLQLAGVLRRVSPAMTHRLLPLVIAGFMINLITGVLFFCGDPLRYAINIGFQTKMVLVLLAGLNAGVYHWRVQPLLSGWDGSTAPHWQIRLVGITSLSCWTGVLLAGRLIPYVGTG